MNPDPKFSTMNLKVLLPFQVLLDVPNVRRIVVETRRGFVGFWPNRLDCTASLVPGIFAFEVGNLGEQYVAIDRGVVVKEGQNVQVSTRNAVAGGDLGKLKNLVESQFKNIEESERQTRMLMAKMEQEIVHKTVNFGHE